MNNLLRRFKHARETMEIVAIRENYINTLLKKKILCENEFNAAVIAMQPIEQQIILCERINAIDAEIQLEQNLICKLKSEKTFI